jgi:hypothetical protein
MQDYFKKTEYDLKKIWFDYCGIRYQGHGLMTWNPDEGFHIEAFLEKPTTSPKRMEFGKSGIIRKSDFYSIRMIPDGFDWAIAPDVYLIDRYDILSKSRLCITLSRVIFCESKSNYNQDEYWRGYALYETKNGLHLSDTVCNTIKINGHNDKRSSNKSGIWYEDDKKLKISGRIIDGKYLQTYWELNQSIWSKADSWQWSEAVQDALSIYYGQNIWLLQRKITRGVQNYIEIRKREEINSLDRLSLLGQQYQLDKYFFVFFTEFLIRDKPNATICRNIFNQMIEASLQGNWQVSELLVSTILEATLRNIDNQPFQAKKGNWKVGSSLKIFIDKYFPQQSQEVNLRVMKAHTYLRDRNAHPDWLFTQGGALSDDEKEKSLDSMIFLSRFYGYMILALAGCRDIEISFPKPHKDWQPLFIIHQLEQNQATTEITNTLKYVSQETLDLQKQLKEAKHHYQRIMIWRRYFKQQS